MALSADMNLPAGKPGNSRRLIVDKLFADLAAGRVEDCVAAFTDDLKMEVPFQSPGMTWKCRSKDDVRALFTWVSENFRPFGIEASQSWEMESDGLVALYATDAVRERTGRPYQNDYVGLFFFEGDLVSHWVEYHNPMVTVVALGR
ncbi:nuclear transport factor 2 family protein [Amycolatopsis pithecellobii]|nr:nuclear transport factor 2 family protein [Amycolatopsis pithecellobii]